jgi:hypothetical protein
MNMNNKEISDLVNLYFSLEIKKKGAHYMFGSDSEITMNCVNQFLKISHKIIENGLENFLLEKIENESGKDENNFQQIDFKEFGFEINLILLENPYAISNVEFNLIVYYSLNQILDLSDNSEYWTEINRLTFLTIYEKDYLKIRRNPLINSILF